MSGKTVDNILSQINNLPNCESVKKLLFLRLEIDQSAKRCLNWNDWNPNKDNINEEKINELEESK